MTTIPVPEYDIDNFIDQVIEADALDVLPTIPSSSIDLICTQPPWHQPKEEDLADWMDFTREWLYECRRILKPTGSIFTSVWWKDISKLYELQESLGFIPQNWIVWNKVVGKGVVGHPRFSYRHEDILWFSKTDNYKFNVDPVRIPYKYVKKNNHPLGSNPGDVWEIRRVSSQSSLRGHTVKAQWPEAIPKRIILSTTEEYDIVLDPFCGSGTVPSVADKLKRSFIAIDIDQEALDFTEYRLDHPTDGWDSKDSREDRLTVKKTQKTQEQRKEEMQYGFR